MSELIIKTKEDVENHFESHHEERDRIMDLRLNFPDNKMNSKEYENLCVEYDKNNVSYGRFDLFYGKIEMYAGDEGDVLSNIQYCPFCGIKFIIEEP